jgi:hypothetical protein
MTGIGARATGLVVAGLMLGCGAIVAPWYVGSGPVLLLFIASWTLLLLVVVQPPCSVGLLALALMWFLGFPVKFLLHLAVDHPFIEPVGDFNFSAGQWDQVLLISSVGAWGAIGGRWGAAALRRQVRPPLRPPEVPRWYADRPLTAWIVTIVGLAAVAVANQTAAFYQIGVETRVILPLRTHVVLAWLVGTGGGLLVALLVDLESRRTRRLRHTMAVLAVIAAESVAMSVSALSRGLVVFRLLPYWLVRLRYRRNHPWSIPQLSVISAVCVLLSVGVVSVRRDALFIPALQGAAPLSPEAPQGPTVPRHQALVSLLGTLAVDRWIGLEGLMVVVGASDVPPWPAILREPPSAGVEGWYQQLARSDYPSLDGFAFLTLPGAIAVLTALGPPPLVLVGIAILVALLIALEELGAMASGGIYVPAVAGVTAANAIAQMHAPYLWAIGLLQMVVALLLLSVARRMNSRTGAR